MGGEEECPLAGGNRSEHLRNSNWNVQLLPSEAGGFSSNPIPSSSQNAMRFIRGPNPLIDFLFGCLRNTYDGGGGKGDT